MTDQRRILSVPTPKGDQRSDREVLLETNRLVHALADRGAKTLQEIEHAIYIIDRPLTELDLSERTKEALIAAGMGTVRALLRESQGSLIGLPAIGRLALSEIREALVTHGLRLADAQVKACEVRSAPEHSDTDVVRVSAPALNREILPLQTEAEKVSLMQGGSGIVKGDLVRHPKRDEWGVGQVRKVTGDGAATIVFEQVGEKTLLLRHVDLIRIGHANVSSPDPLQPAGFNQDENAGCEGAKVVCSNCGQPTLFTEQSSAERCALGWCNACFTQSKRTFSDSVTGEKRYFDDLRTVDGIKHRYFSPK